MALWQNIWFVLIYTILCIYSILDGFDLGIGMILPLYKKEDERKKILGTIFPFWDGNELWLLIGGTVLFAVSPVTYSSILSGFYPGLMFIIFAVTCRAVSFEFLYMDDKKRSGLWQKFFFVSSIIMAGGGMISMGNILSGYPLDAMREFTGNITIFFRPLTLITAAFGITSFIMHGISYLMVKTDGGLRERSVKIGKIFSMIYPAVFVIFMITVFVTVPGAAGKFIFLGGALVTLTGIIMLYFAVRSVKPKLTFLFSSLSIAGFWLLSGGVLYPDIIKASNDPSLSITIFNGSSSEQTLKYLAVFTAAGMALIFIYTVFIYRVFRNKSK